MKKSAVAYLVLYSVILVTLYLIFLDDIPERINPSNKNDITEVTETPVASAASLNTISKKNGVYNVLFIMTDDMRAQLGYYKEPEFRISGPPLHTPNLDRLAARSLVLKNAFVQYSLCNPSRTSMLTSRRPDETGIRDNHHYWRKLERNLTTLPQYFKNHGYTTVGIGKIFHQGPINNYQDPVSWSEPFQTFYNNDNLHIKKANNSRWRAVPNDDMQSLPLVDIMHLNKAKEYILKVARRSKPFFLGLGFKKPHTAQVCPERFFHHYTLPEGQYLSDQELHEFKYNDTVLNNFRRAYYACVSFVDWLVGDIVSFINEHGLGDSTIVSFVSDHGFHYGEHGHMAKSRNFDMTTRVPMMMHIPGQTDRGISSDVIVEALDLFPTLVEAAGLPQVPTCTGFPTDRTLCVRGTSLMPLIKSPMRKLKEAAFSQMTKYIDGLSTQYSIRTKKYRLSIWTKFKRENNVMQIVIDREAEGHELYDHVTDPAEYDNKAYDSDYSKVFDSLYKQLHAFISKYNIP